MPEILKNAGVYTHLVSDHYHYWEEGGCNYHTRYNSWEITRGQEGDPWKGQVREPEIPPSVSPGGPPLWRQDWVNRQYLLREEDQPQYRTVELGLEFIRANAAEDNWFLQIETFDPHEPFFTQKKYKDLYPHEYSGKHFDWPRYRRVSEAPEEVRHMRMEYAALVSMCDEHLGKVLDAMDACDLWKDTMLIVNTDHGFFLGERDWWAKMVMPCYNEIANTPLFIWEPRSGARGRTCGALVQTIDLPATLLEYFGQALPPDTEGRPLREAISTGKAVREAGLFGVFGSHVNCTDGRYVYMRAGATGPLCEYTHMPTHMRRTFEVDQMRTMTAAPPFRFTKGCPVMRIDGGGWRTKENEPTMLFDLEKDPLQERPISDARVERMMIDHMTRLMRENDAPEEQFARLGLSVGR